MTNEPIYLLDFRNQRVVELDSTVEVDLERPTDQTQASHPTKSITFAALGSPADRKD